VEWIAREIELVLVLMRDVVNSLSLRFMCVIASASSCSLSP
jgi:hypothetical protein